MKRNQPENRQGRARNVRKILPGHSTGTQSSGDVGHMEYDWSEYTPIYLLTSTQICHLSLQRIYYVNVVQSSKP